MPYAISYGHKTRLDSQGKGKIETKGIYMEVIQDEVRFSPIMKSGMVSRNASIVVPISHLEKLENEIHKIRRDLASRVLMAGT